MNYKINIEPLKQPLGDIRAYVTMSIGDVICVRGIKLCETNEGKLFVDLPKRTIRGSRGEDTRLIIAPTEKFSEELFSNIIDTYKKGKYELEVTSDKEDINYKITTVKVNKNNCKGIVNIQFEDNMRIYGFKVMYGADGALFLSNPAVIRNNEYYDVAYPSDADFKNHILENSISMLDEQQKTYTLEENKKLVDLRKQLKAENDNLSHIRDFMRDIYSKIDDSISEDTEKSYMETLALGTFSVFELEDKIKKIEENIAKIEKSQIKSVRR